MVVQLRPLTMADWKAVHGWAQRAEVCHYQAWGPNTVERTVSFVRAAVEAWADRPRKRFFYAVTCGSQVVGNGELRLHGNRQGEISYLIHPDLWGQGLATAAARELLAVGFTTHWPHSRVRETVLIRDGWRDSDLYAVLESEFKSERPQ